MATTNAMSLYIGGGQAIPVKADETKFSLFVNKQSTTTVIVDGELSVVGSAKNDENRQTIEVMVPTVYQDQNIVKIIRDIIRAAGSNGINATLKNDNSTEVYRYRNCFIIEGGEVEDKDGRFMNLKLEGVQIVAG